MLFCWIGYCRNIISSKYLFIIFLCNYLFYGKNNHNIIVNIMGDELHMKNFLISAAADIVLILISYYTFRKIISGPTRHGLYEKFMSSFAKFVIYIFIASLVITGVTALVLYKTRFIVYINIIAPALVSLLIGFVVSIVPTKGYGDNK